MILSDFFSCKMFQVNIFPLKIFKWLFLLSCKMWWVTFSPVNCFEWLFLCWSWCPADHRFAWLILSDLLLQISAEICWVMRRDTVNKNLIDNLFIKINSSKSRCWPSAVVYDDLPSVICHQKVQTAWITKVWPQLNYDSRTYFAKK